jgi:hypothetical protein
MDLDPRFLTSYIVRLALEEAVDTEWGVAGRGLRPLNCV